MNHALTSAAHQFGFHLLERRNSCGLIAGTDGGFNDFYKTANPAETRVINDPCACIATNAFFG